MGPSTLGKLLTLAPQDRALFLRAFWDLGRTYLELGLLGFGRMLRQIDASGSRVARVVTPEDVERAEHYAGWIVIASRHHVVPGQCLERSLVLHRWLKHEALPSKLCIGVRKEDGALKAHAWIELGSTVVNDRPESLVPFQLLKRPRET